CKRELVRLVRRVYAAQILIRNYRSPKKIVEYSQKVMRHNQRRVPKNVQAASKVNASLEVLQMPNLTESIDYVVNEVRSMLASGTIKKVALIGRKRGQIIPYQIVDRKSTR